MAQSKKSKKSLLKKAKKTIDFGVRTRNIKMDNLNESSDEEIVRRPPRISSDRPINFDETVSDITDNLANASMEDLEDQDVPAGVAAGVGADEDISIPNAEQLRLQLSREKWGNVIFPCPFQDCSYEVRGRRDSLKSHLKTVHRVLEVLAAAFCNHHPNPKFPDDWSELYGKYNKDRCWRCYEK